VYVKRRSQASEKREREARVVSRWVEGGGARRLSFTLLNLIPHHFQLSTLPTHPAPHQSGSLETRARTIPPGRGVSGAAPLPTKCDEGAPPFGARRATTRFSRPSVDRFTHLPRHAHPAPQSTRHAPVHAHLLRPSCLCDRCYARGRYVGRASSRGAEVDGRRPKKGPMGSGARALPRTPAPLATARQSNVPPGPPCQVDALVDAKSDPRERAGWRAGHRPPGGAGKKRGRRVVPGRVAPPRPRPFFHRPSCPTRTSTRAH